MNRNARQLAAAAVLATFAAVAGAEAALAAAGGIRRAAQPVAGQYIVVLRDESIRPARADRSDARPSVAELAAGLADQHRGRSGRRFESALAGFVFRGGRADAAALAADPRVAYVAEDGWVEVAGQATPPSWGLDRIDQRGRALDAWYDFYADGATVDVFVVDTGIRSTHVDFEGRVDLGVSYSAIADGNGTEDCHGHGTHVAGVVGGATYGVAKGVTLHPVRVLDCAGRGTVSQIVAGIDWITARYATTTGGGGTGGGGKKGGGKNGSGTVAAAATARAVVNLSFATTWTSVLDEAVSRSIAAGLVYVIAAGNTAEDACYVSPARVAGAITVGATAADDSAWAASNFGPCVDLWAPGYGVVSAFARSDTDEVTMAGTSMAAPHVAGTAALLLSMNPALTPDEISTLLNAAATSGALVVPAGSPNKLVYAPFTGYGMDMAPVAEFTFTCSSGTCKYNAAPSVDDRGILGYSWSLGGGKSASGEAVSVKYSRSVGAQVTVTLNVTDTTGQVSSVSKVVRTGF
jgi:subtilisin family serine protease